MTIEATPGTKRATWYKTTRQLTHKHDGTGDRPPRPARTFPTGITPGLSSPVRARHPVAIEGLPDGSVLILESDPDLTYSTVLRYVFGRPGGTQSLDNVLADLLDAAVLTYHGQRVRVDGFRLLQDPDTQYEIFPQGSETHKRESHE